MWFILLLISGVSLQNTPEDLLMHDKMCPIHLITTISIVPADTPAQCQGLCYELPECSYFSLYSYSESKTTSCAMFRYCPQDSTFSCSTDTNITSPCSFAVSGPREPAITDVSCSKFVKMGCNGDLLSQQFNVNTGEKCQDICEKTVGCSYFTQYGKDLCQLYKTCHTKDMVECSLCTSGPVRPDISTCQDNSDAQATLLIGGITGVEITSSSSIEMIREEEVCTPALPELPFGVYGASAVLKGSSILHCGGYGVSPPHYRADCYFYTLGKGWDQWKRASSMNYPRSDFSLAVYKEKTFAVGGNSDYGAETSGSVVEVYTPYEGWMVDESMKLDRYRYGHCSVLLGPNMMILGGNYGGEAYSTTVRVFDLAVMQGWYTRPSMHYGRHHHSCLVAPFQGQEGIFVAGGSNKDHSLVEFYAPSVNKWRILSPLNAGRQYHSSSFISGSLHIHGGSIQYQEILNETLLWSPGASLSIPRYYHASVTIPAQLVTCLDNQEDNEDTRKQDK